MSKWDKENKSHSYKLDGSEALGSCLQVKPCSNEVLQVSKCSFQWYRLSSEGSWREVISGTVLLMPEFTSFVSLRCLNLFAFENIACLDIKIYMRIIFIYQVLTNQYMLLIPLMLGECYKWTLYPMARNSH